MPERVHTLFEDDSAAPPSKRPKLGISKEITPASPRDVPAAAPAEAQKKGPGKAPSRVARSIRRAAKFKESRGENAQQADPKPTIAANVSKTLLPETFGKQSKDENVASNGNGKDRLSKNPRRTSPQTETSTLQKGNLKAKAASLQHIRQSLPIWPHAKSIRQALRDRNILILVGETGSGKSTQVPQFLLSEAWTRPQTVMTASESFQSPGDSTNDAATKRKIRVGGCIAVTEPRRVAATTLARRVAEEMGTPLGKASPASTVGYAVRFDENTSPNNKIKFVTEGMLLQEMLRDPWLTRYSAVVVDEVHERGINVDLLLGFLRRLLARVASDEEDGRGGVPLKVIVMSATAEGSELLKYFEEGLQDLTADTDLTPESARDKTLEWSGLSDVRAEYEKAQLEEQDDIPKSSKHVAALYFRGRQHPVKILYTPNPVADVLEASLMRIFTINHQEPLPGDVLVFLTGQKAVESLCALIEEYSATLSKSVPKLLPLPLFAALPQDLQRRVFEPAPAPAKGHRGTRRVIVSTNIAETSVTVTGVRYVIDGGKEKIKQFRPRIGLDSLLTKPISASSAIQRAGRAGREAAGRCYRLYTEADFNKLPLRASPEILRCDLAQAVLSLMARGVSASTVSSFPLLTVPDREAFKAALVQLHQLGAVDDDGLVTKAGLLMAGLPVSASMARALLKAAEPDMDCLDDMIDLVAGMSGEGIFVHENEEDEENLDVETRSRRDEFWRRDGDHSTMILAVRGFAAEQGDRRKWAETRRMNWRALRGIMDIRKQLLALRERLVSQPLSTQSPAAAPPASASAHVSPNVLRCLLAGFPLNAALLAPDGSYRTVSGRQTVAVHPSSVLFRRTLSGPDGPQQQGGSKPAAIVYTEFVYTTRAYARGVSAVEVEWVAEALGANWGD